MDRGALRA